MSYTGIPTYVEGNTVTIPPGIFEIAGGCSGLRYLLVSLAISSLFIFLNIKKTSHGVLFLFIAILGSLITNWIRITGLILIGYFTDMESSLMADHNTFGWYLYIPFIIGLFYLGQKITNSSENQIKDKFQQNITLPLKAIFTSLVIILACSSAVQSALFTDNSIVNSQCDDIPEASPFPQLHNISSRCAQIDGDQITVNYHFDAKDLNSSVDFYLNVYTPESWEVISHEQTPQWNILQIQKGDMYATISYKFLAVARETTNLTELKTFKLSNAFKSKRGTSLIWRIKLH